MRDITPKEATANDIPYLLACINKRLGVVCDWIQEGCNQQDPHAILSVEEAVAFTGYSKSTIHSATSNDTIPHFKRGNRLFFYKDELVKWLEADDAPKRGKRFKKSGTTKEEDADSVSGVLPSENVTDCAVSEAIVTDEESADSPSETAPQSGTYAVSKVDECQQVNCVQEESGSEALANEHLSNDSVQQQGEEATIPSFPLFNLVRQPATDSISEKTVIHFFNIIAHEHFRTVCNIVEEHHGQRVGKSVNFEFGSYDDALQAAYAINAIVSPGLSENH